MTHGATARFLTGTGLPDVAKFPFIADDDLAEFALIREFTGTLQGRQR